MPATRPTTRVQRRAQPAAPRRPPSRRRTATASATTMQQPESSGVSCEASSSVATTSAPDAASPATTVPDETVQRIVSAVSQAVLASLNGACATTLPPPSSAVETRELPIVASGIASFADATMQGPVASALNNLSVYSHHQSLLIEGHAVSRKLFTDYLALIFKTCGLDPTKYKGPSFRIGAATFAAECGFSDAQIRSMGRWKSDAFRSFPHYNKDVRYILPSNRGSYITTYEEGYRDCPVKEMTDPYGICDKIPKLCDSTTQDVTPILRPTILSTWKLSYSITSGSRRLKWIAPKPASKLYLRAKVSLLMTHEKNIKCKSEYDTRARGGNHAVTCCREGNQHFIRWKNICVDCPNKSTSHLGGYYCERNE